MGSVLSYDILCHQENPSSPSPRDLIYGEHARSEGLSGVDNQSSVQNSCLDTEDNCSTAVYGCSDFVHIAKEGDERSMHQMHLHLENPSVVVDPVASHPSVLSNKHENPCKVDEYDIRLPQISNELEELNKNENCDLEVPSVNRIGELQFEDSNDKDEVIKSLKEEVCRLSIMTHRCYVLFILICLQRTRMIMHSLARTCHVLLISVCFQRVTSIYRMSYLNFLFVRLIILK